MKRPIVATKNVLITGCSSGIGLATANLLRERGWQVVPTARSDEDLEHLRSDGFSPVRLDLASEETIEKAWGDAHELCGGVMGGLVNNAGYALAGAIEEVEANDLRRQLEVNLIGLQQLTCRAVDSMRAQGWGRIVNVSSIYGRIAAPLVGSYCASKFALEAMSDALRNELWSSGIGVSLMVPGPIVTDFRKNAAIAAEEALDLESDRFGEHYRRRIVSKKKRRAEPDFFRKSPEAVAGKIRHALESARPRRRYYITPAAHLGALLRRFAPDTFLDYLARRSAKL